MQIKDAPAGGFKYVGGSVGFDIENIKECGYYLSWPYNGTVPGVGRNIDYPLTKISDTEYEGTFYTDWGQDGDFFGKGVCHWKFTGVGVGLSATGADGETKFLTGFNVDVDEFPPKEPLTRFYRKKVYPRLKEMDNYADDGVSTEVASTQDLTKLFSITITVQEVQ